jgi:hypothetical protein
LKGEETSGVSWKRGGNVVILELVHFPVPPLTTSFPVGLGKGDEDVIIVVVVVMGGVVRGS